MHDVVEFLRRHAPFDDLDEEQLEGIAAATEVEFFAAGAQIFRQGEGPIEHVRVVRRGAVELLADGEVLDSLGEGELFGHPSMLSGFPAWFEARAGEDSLCYRIPAGIVLPLLGSPSGLRFVARTLIERPWRRSEGVADLDRASEPVARLVRGPAVVCDPAWSIRQVARQMADAEASAALVRLGNGDLGIVTDRDLRDRVVAGDLALDAPVKRVMSAPAATVTPDRSGADVMLEMLARDVHHMPVVWPHGEVLGVLGDRDLLGAETQVPFSIRREIADAPDPSALRAAAARMRASVISLHDSEVPPSRIAAIISVVADAITRRLIELAIDDLGEPPAAFAWMALGSFGRREAVPSSDIESGLVWDRADEAAASPYAADLGARVVADLGRVGFAVDSHGVTAAQAVLDRSFESWRTAIRGVIEDPEQEQGMIFISLLADARTSYRLDDPRDPLEELAQIRHRRPVLRLLLRLALAHRPPTGLRRLRARLEGGEEDGSGERRGHLDVKRSGLLPIVGIARYASLAAGAHSTSTRERLGLAATGGTLDGGDARALREAFELFWRLRLDHQVEQLRAGLEPDDYIDTGKLSPVTRGYVREAFHGVATVQRSLRGELTLPP
jgi:CBS domain-containing protein